MSTMTEEDVALTPEARAAVDSLLADERSIYQRVLAILDELPAIGKDQRNQQQNFMYRGHDDVMNALNPLLAKHGVFFVPVVISRVTGERMTGSNKTMYEVNLLVEFTFYGAGGDSFVASAWGEGTDMGDKSTNKAMTMALKNVVAQTFALCTAELSDADATSPEETVRAGSDGGERPARSQRQDEEPFDVGKHLLPNAARGADSFEQLKAKQLALASDLDWTAMLDAAAVAALGPKSKRTKEQKDQLPYRWANTIAKLEQLAEASPDYHPDLGLKAGEEGDALIIAAVEFAFGFKLSGPLPRIEGETAPEAAQEAPAPEEPSERGDDDPPGMSPSDEGMSSA